MHISRAVTLDTLGGILLLALVVPLSAEAKTLYVNGATGVDAVPYRSNSESSPWRSIGRAAWGSTDRSVPNSTEAAQAGDTVLVAAGNYATAGSDSRNIPAYNPANSGTERNPITFEAVGPVTLTLSSSRGSVIGAYERNYIVWKGFSINENHAPSHPDTGSVTFWFSAGSTVENLTLDGNGDPGHGDNHPGIRIEISKNITARNNIIRNYRTSGVNPMNGAGIQIYNSKGLLIEQNDISNCGTGIYFKQIGWTSSVAVAPAKISDQSDIVRYNLIHDVLHGLLHLRHAHTSPDVYVLWHQNIVLRAAEGGITIWGFNSAGLIDGPTNGRFVNNTIYGSQHGVFLVGVRLREKANMLLQNNLIVNSRGHALYNEPARGNESWEIDRLRMDWNWYYGNRSFANDGTQRTIENFQATYDKQETNSTDGADPGFVASANADFHLSKGSPALTGGRAVHGIGGKDGERIPVGAYITGDEIIGHLP
jgi:Right handed beta helix region